MDLNELIELGLSEDLAQKVIDANEKKGWIPYSRFKEVNDDLKTIKDTLKERDKQIDDLSKLEGLQESHKQEIARLQQENKAATEKLNAELEKERRNNAITFELVNNKEYKVVDVDIVKTLLKEDALKFEDGKIKDGLSEQLKELKESKPYLFVKEEKNLSFNGWKPQDKGLEKNDADNKGSIGLGARLSKK